jgi:hypothetical protein
MGMRSLHLAIDHILVEGLPVSGQRQFVSALEERLRELAAIGIPEELARNTRKKIESLSAGQLRPQATPAEAATQVANSIWRGLGASGGNQTFSGLGQSGGAGAQRNV